MNHLCCRECLLSSPCFGGFLILVILESGFSNTGKFGNAKWIITRLVLVREFAKKLITIIPNAYEITRVLEKRFVAGSCGYRHITGLHSVAKKIANSPIGACTFSLCWSLSPFE